VIDRKLVSLFLFQAAETAREAPILDEDVEGDAAQLNGGRMGLLKDAGGTRPTGQE
jgi:hypothetical protein